VRRSLSLVFAIASLSLSLSSASAAGGHESGGTQLPRDPAAVTDEGARAKAMASEVRAAAKTPPADVAASLAKTQQALARASGAHAVGDSRTARLLGKVALGWAEAAKTQLAATLAEKASGEAEKVAADLASRRDRGRALVTESQARKGQLASRIERKKLDVEAAKAPREKAKPGDKKPADARPGDKKAPPKKPADKAPKKGAQP
jgi:hypothetical protein